MSKQLKSLIEAAELLRKNTLSVEEAAEILRLERSRAYRWAQRGKIPTIKVGQFYCVPTSVLAQFVEA